MVRFEKTDLQGGHRSSVVNITYQKERKELATHQGSPSIAATNSPCYVQWRGSASLDPPKMAPNDSGCRTNFYS